MAKAYRPPYDPPEHDFSDFNFEKYEKKNNIYIEELRLEAKQNGKSDLLGEILRWQRGDGYAMYMVWDTKPLKLIHLPIDDAWSVEDALIRGLRISDVKEMVEQDKALSKIFGE